jgi:opacity protein-like surface antigen
MIQKITVTILLIASVAFTLNAQTKQMAVGANFVLSLPIGDFSNGANLGYGGMGNFEYAFMPQLVGTGSIGYIKWGTDADNVDFHAIPILVGVKYFFIPGVGFYGAGQLGLAILSASVDIPSVSFGGVTYGGGSASSSDTKFSFSFGAGYEVPVSPTVALDFKALFNLLSDANNIQFGAGAKVAL